MSADRGSTPASSSGDDSRPAALLRGRPKAPFPRGVMLLSLLLYGAAVVSAAATVEPSLVLPGLPRWVHPLNMTVTTVLATGLLLRRRWAWFATLAWVVVNAYYLLLDTTLLGGRAFAGLSLLAAVAAYLLWPGVRAVYLARDT